MMQPRSLQLARGLLYLSALLWFVFGAIIAFGVHPSYPPGSHFYLPMAAGAFIAGIVLGVLGWLLRRPAPAAYWLSLAALTVALLIGLLDQIGLADLVPLLITAVTLALLIRNRGWYAKSSEGATHRRAA